MNARTASVSGRIGGAMAWAMAARAGRFALGFASSVLVVRGLGQHDYGVLSIVRASVMFAVLLAGAGTGQALLKFLPALRVAGAAPAARRLLRTVVCVHLAGWLALAAAAFVARGAVEHAFHADGVGIYVALGVALALFEVLFTVASHVLNSSFDAKRLSIASLASHGTYLVGLVVVFAQGWGVAGVLVAAAAGNVLACTLVLYAMAKATSFGTGTGVSDLTRARVLRYSLPFAAIGVLNLVVWRQSETFMLAHFRTPEETGFFDVAYRLPQTILEFVPGTVWPLVMAGMSEAFARDRASLARAVDRYYRLLFVLCAPICVAGAVMAGRAVEVLYGEGMAPAAVPAQVFFLIFTVSFLSTPLSMVLYVLEKTQVNLLIYLSLAVVNIGLDLVLIPRYGVAGAIVPVAIAIALQPLLYGIAVRRYAAISIPFRFIGRCFAGAAFSLLAVPVLYVVDGAAGLVAGGVVAVTATAVAFRYARVLHPDDIAAIATIPTPLAGRLARFLGGA